MAGVHAGTKRSHDKIGAKPHRKPLQFPLSDKTTHWPTIPENRKKMAVFVVGDSHVYWMGRLVEKECHDFGLNESDVYLFGTRGARVNYMFDFFKMIRKFVEEYRPEKAIWISMVAGNDLYFDEEMVMTTAIALCDLANATRSSKLVDAFCFTNMWERHPKSQHDDMTTSEYNMYVRKLNKYMQCLADGKLHDDMKRFKHIKPFQKLDNVYFEKLQGLVDIRQYLRDDGIHLTDDGLRQLCKSIRKKAILLLTRTC